MSVAIPAIQQAFGSSKAGLGLIGSFFLWIYGIGQLINGYIGDKIPGRIFTFIGLAITAITNILFSFTSSLAAMIFLWAVNGFFQSMLLGADYKNPFRHRSRRNIGHVSSVGISTTMVGGYLLGWGLSGQILTTASWHWAFRLPGILALTYAVIWLVSTRKLLASKTAVRAAAWLHWKTWIPEIVLLIKTMKSPWQFIKVNRLWVIAVVCECQGIIKESISLWGPLYLMETHSIALFSTTSYILPIPLMNLKGSFYRVGWTKIQLLA